MECESMCCNSNYSGGYSGRNFLTRAEKVEMLKEYLNTLTNEVEGIKERIETLEKKDE